MSCEGCAKKDSCSSAGQGGCGEKTEIKKLETAKGTKIKKIIGISSGKGGVGKSFVTSYLAKEMALKGYKVGILDGDILGPSIPRNFNMAEEHLIVSNEDGLMVPMETYEEIKIMSSNLLLPDETSPIIYRGVLLSGIIQQFYSDTNWGELDFLFVDMPPGTGDVPLTVFQSIPVDGIIIVTSPQDLVSMVVSKAIKMAEMMDVPVLGIVENYSYFKCPDCGKEHQIFGPSKADDVAKEFGLEVLAKLPIDPKLAALCDRGMIEAFEGDWLDEAAAKLEK